MSPPASPAEPPIAAVQNPNLWRFTWEAQSHMPTLRLLLFRRSTDPSTQCRDLKVTLRQSLLTASFLENEDAQRETTVQIPIPGVLVDPEAPLSFRALDDHIDVKLVLLLPVDHPLVLDFSSEVDFEGQDSGGGISQLSVDYDLKKLACMKEVHFYCRNCSTKLTKGIRCFDEMPSVNWRDVADNWFGNCCCSFGGASEKLVAEYVKSYACAPGICFLTKASVLLHKNDLLGREFPDVKGNRTFEPDLNTSYDNCTDRVPLDETGNQNLASCNGNHNERLQGTDGILKSSCADNATTSRTETETSASIAGDDSLSSAFSELNIEENEELSNKKGDDSLYSAFSELNIEESEELSNKEGDVGDCHAGICTHDVFQASSKLQTTRENFTLHENQKVFVDGYLGSGFMVRTSGLSKGIEWVSYLCPKCSYLVGSYPCFGDRTPIDGGVRLFKYSISTCSSSSESNDALRDYTLERMFASQLLENAEDELSFRAVIKDIHTKSPELQIVLLNPSLWYCAGSLNPIDGNAKLLMQPSVKVLFASSNQRPKFDLETSEDWVRKKQADEIYMFSSQIQELIRGLGLANSLYPPSCASLDGLFLSSMRR